MLTFFGSLVRDAIVHAALWNKMTVILHAVLCVMWILPVIEEKSIVTERNYYEQKREKR